MAPGRLQVGAPTSKWEITANLGQLLIGCIWLLFFVGFIALGASVPPLLASDSIALSNSPECGLYLLNASDGESVFRGARAYEFDALVDSSTLAHNCYKAPALNDDCNYFTHRSTPYNIEHNASCPFRGGLCHSRSGQAIHFSTPEIDAKVIGVNAPKTYQFRRSCTCSPLNMNRTFISSTNEANKYVFRYHYGHWGRTNFMFETRSSGQASELSGYSVR